MSNYVQYINCDFTDTIAVKTKRWISRNSRMCVLKEHWETTSIFISIINETSLADFHDKFPLSFYALSFIMTALVGTRRRSSEYFSYSITMQPGCHILFGLLKTTPISKPWDKPRFSL